MTTLAIEFLPNRTGTCECGRRKRRAAEACSRCLHLDGAGAIQAEIIDYLRGAGSACRTDIEAAIYGYSTHTANGTAVLRVIGDLERRKRIQRRPGDDGILRFTLREAR